MPRIERLIPVDAAMHIMCRGNNKQNIFHREKDKLYYLFLLRKLKEENRLKIFHYCLLNNHLHLILWLNARSNLSKFMKQVNLSYFNYFKKNYGYFGHFWQDRYKSNIIEKDSYLLQCGKYIELNPVRAGIVSSPEEYKYSSYNYYARGFYDSLLTPNPVFLGLSNSEVERRKLYIEFVVDSNSISKKGITKQLFIGSEEFTKKMQRSFQIENTRKKRGRPRKLIAKK
jgi:putative transposase